MARNFLASALVARARNIADTENDENISEAQYKEWLSTAYGEFYGIIAESGMRHFENEDEITSNGTATAALPDDYLATIGVDYETTPGGRRVELDELMAQERNIYSGATNASPATAYAIVGGNIVFYPTPAAGQTYFHVYIPQPADLSNYGVSDTVDVITPDGEQFIIKAIAVEIKIKCDEDPRDMERGRDQARQRVVDWALARSFNTPRRLQPSSDDYDYRPGDWYG